MLHISTQASFSSLINSFSAKSKSTLIKTDGYLNTIGSKINAPEHALSWILGAATAIATPFIIYKTYCYITQYIIDQKPDSYIIERAQSFYNKTSDQFNEMFEQVIELKNAITPEQQLLSKINFKETLLSNSPGRYPFLQYKWNIDNAQKQCLQEQEIITRRLNQIANRENSPNTHNDDDNSLHLLTNLYSSLTILDIDLENIKKEIIACYEYRHEATLNAVHMEQQISNALLHSALQSQRNIYNNY